jgi:hypothetical protein
VYSAPHCLLTFHGILSGTTETWSFGLRVLPASTGAQAAADQARDIFANWFGLAANGFISTARFSYAKVANIEPDGHYPPTGLSAEGLMQTPLPGASTSPGTTYVLPQSSICATLTTDTPRGLASKGRIYLPPQAFPITNGQLATADAQVVANGVKSLITQLNAATLFGNVQVMSRGKGVKAVNPTTGKTTYTYPNAGVSRDVLGCRVGRVVDTQRRRRRQLAEAPVTGV